MEIAKFLKIFSSSIDTQKMSISQLEFDEGLNLVHNVRGSVLVWSGQKLIA